MTSITIPKVNKPLYWFMASHENTGGLSNLRFIQDTATNWFPKAIFTRSKADFADMTFLEFLESALFYYAPNWLGEGLFRRLFSKFLPKESRKSLEDLVVEPAENLLKNKELVKEDVTKKILPIKAAIVSACLCIPMAEYALSYVKNLFTLKFFNTADFSRIAGLNKTQTEDKQHKEDVKKSAKKHIAMAAAISVAGLAMSFVFAAFGQKSKTLQKLSEVVLRPGAKLYSILEKGGIKSKKVEWFLKKYVNFDFDKKEIPGKKAKLCLSNGQLAVSVILGTVGYFGAAKDRGKLDYLETLSRVPFVAFYLIFGSSLLEHFFKKYLRKKDSFKDLIDKDLKVPKLDEITNIAKGLSIKNGTSFEYEWKKLFKGKATITMVPFLFNLLVMGFFIAGMSRFWTKYRYNKGIGKENNHKCSFYNQSSYQYRKDEK